MRDTKMKKIIENIIYTICLLMLTWGLLSYVEIIAKNGSPNPQYSDNNLIVRICYGDR